jgi:hypothetical protein
MEDFMEMIFALAIMVGFSLLVAQMSKEKDIGFWTLFACSLLLTPFVGLIIGLFAKKRQKEGELVMPNASQQSFLSRFTSNKRYGNDKNDNMDMPNFDNPK